MAKPNDRGGWDLTDADTQEIIDAIPDPPIGMVYKIVSVREELGRPTVPDIYIIRVRIWTDKGWVEADFNRELVFEHVAEMMRLANDEKMRSSE